jgi:ectoine hydroxylase-related dioxygenase (phytanoyl-CoA dioxygenase family)
MIKVNCKNDQDWLEKVLAAVVYDGCAVVEGVLDPELVSQTHEAMYAVQRKIRDDVGEERLQAAGELGVLRLMIKYDPFFFRFLELPEVLAVVDATVSETAILHVQNGLVLPSFDEGATPDVFQTRFHRDFPRILNGYLMSINTFFALHDFSPETGGTLFAPGTHQHEGRPSDFYLAEEAATAECSPGSMVVFDSTVWHAAGDNASGRDRMALNQQFTRSYVKQQVDYVRALGDETVLAQSPRTQQLLGWYTRVVTSLDEFYRPADQRLYRSGQG